MSHCLFLMSGKDVVARAKPKAISCARRALPRLPASSQRHNLMCTTEQLKVQNSLPYKPKTRTRMTRIWRICLQKNIGVIRTISEIRDKKESSRQSVR
jgi:hypothetical protein